jgi:hypothetical protein
MVSSAGSAHVRLCTWRDQLVYTGQSDVIQASEGPMIAFGHAQLAAVRQLSTRVSVGCVEMT